ncbi:MAG: nucleoside deaminase [Pseudomonadota bacterium]|nr:nucleoside deaminase [Pseudomonadota bacterium]
MNLAETDLVFLRQAIGLSDNAHIRGDGGPFGAVIVKNEQVIGKGWNRVLVTHDPTAHAEVTAIRDACAHLGTHDLAGSVIYTSCEPCPMCLAAIYWARLDRIVMAATRTDAAAIGFDDDLIYRQIALDPSMRKVPAEIGLRADALSVMRVWAESGSATAY